MLGGSFLVAVFRNTVSAGLMLSFFLPAVQHRLMLPLVGRASEHEGLLLPDTAAG